MVRRESGGRAHRLAMRFYENWWEHLPNIVRLAPIAVALVGLVLQRPLDYHWE
jgi:hypothetical protein